LTSAEKFLAVCCDHFSGAVDDVAVDLIGRTLRVAGDRLPIDAVILETEAYGGSADPASHAAFKPKGGARLMWERPGTIYVFAAYGMYPCLNIVAEREGEPGAVLIRGAMIAGSDAPVFGPGRLGRALGVTLDDNGLLCCGNRYQISLERQIYSIDATPRIGITRGVETPWRFIAILD
jgi:DNA-3-methyladenine glycosylase